MARTLAAGIDSSTQSCTVVLRQLTDGRVVGEARAPHPPTTPPRSEQDPLSWWTALLKALQQLGPQLDQVATCSVGGQGHGLVLLDGTDQPLRPAKLWNDTEPAPDAARLRQLLPPCNWAERTGSVPGPALTVSKLAWTERCYPGLVGRAAHVLLPFDYLVYRLSGHKVTERGGSSGTGYFNPFTNRWDLDLARLGAPSLATDQLPAIVESNQACGRIVDGPFPQLDGGVVGAGTGDNMAAALGLGAEEGDIVISLGTSGTVYGVTPVGVKDGSGAINGYADATGRFLPMVTTLNAAKVTDCFRRLLGVTVDEFDALALEPRRSNHALILIPYLDGERTPDLPNATGRLLNVRTSSTRGEVARAAVEGVLCGLLAGLDWLAHQGVQVDRRLILTGGAARSVAFRQTLADLTGSPVWISPLAETAAAGAAVQAAAALEGEQVAKVAKRWAPELRLGAQPDPAFPRGLVRTQYQAAVLTHFGTDG
ncbi:MAG TPA: FGGY family carbohydrate kinase [Chthoniobacterales bacterium]